MASNNLTRNNKTPHSSLPNTTPNKKGVIVGDDVHIDKKRKLEVDKMVVTSRGGRSRQAFSDLNGSQDVAPDIASISNVSSDCGGLEFSKEGVEALLNEKSKVKGKWKDKERCEEMKDYIKRLRQCIRHYQQVEGNYEFDSENLRRNLESSEMHRAEIEMQLKNNKEESSSIISELRKNYADVQEKLSKEKSEKLSAMDTLAREKEARLEGEKSVASLSEELGKAQRDLEFANQKILGLTETHRRAQDYNISLQQYNCKLQKDLEEANDNLKNLEAEKTKITENLSALRLHCNLLQEQLTSISVSYNEVMKQKDELINEVASLRKELQRTRDDSDHQLLQLKEKCAFQIDRITTLEDQLGIAEKKLRMCGLSALETQAEFEASKKLINDLQIRLADTEAKLFEGEMLRKKLHNTVLELKGNIRVFCRVRPSLPHETPHKEGKVTIFPTSVELFGRGIELMQSGQKHSFTFDKVFKPDATQEDVFTEISQLIQSALDGYKVCIFAYGQTGSGKTYTMMGKPGHHEEKGLIPRSLEQIFQTREFLESQGWIYEMQVSMLEIYNETIRDLLSKSSNSDISKMENPVGKQYAIKHDANRNNYVSDLTVVDVHNIKEVSSLLEQAAHGRSIGKTQMNEYSSRSHFVFTLKIFGFNKSTGQQSQGVLNLIDLAGSECISKSGSTGDRLKETQAINKSLSCLGDVIFALGKKDDYIPFRNSKLTYLLQPYLGGDSKTLMFVNMSPDPSSVNESLCSLRFGARVNSCEIGIPRRQMNVRSSDSNLSYG